MKKNQIFLLVALVIAVPVIALQFVENSKLKNEAESLRSLAKNSGTHRPAVNSRPERSRPALKRERSEKFSAVTLRDILSQPDPMSRMQALLAYIDTLSGAEIPAALEALRKTSPEWDPEAKMLAHILLTRWAQDDPDAAYASLASINPKKNGSDATSILASLASMDPQRAAAWLADPANTLANLPWMGQFLAGSVAKEWVRTDPDAALAWASSLPESQRSGAYSGVLGTLAASDPERASTIAMTLSADASRTHIVGEIAKSWARSSPEAALAWAQSLEGRDRGAAMNEALGTWAQQTPDEAAAFLTNLSASESIDPYITRIAGAWSSQSPADAAKWVTSQAAGSGRTEAMGHVAWNWTNADPVAASTWLGEQPAGPDRDNAIGGLAKAAFPSDPAGALNWAAEISNENSRTEAMNRGLREWSKRDPEAAHQWADQHDVPVPAAGGK